MKTFKTSAIVLMLSLVAANALYAQDENSPVDFAAQQMAVSVESAPAHQNLAKAHSEGRTFDIAMYQIKDSMKMRLLIEKAKDQKLSIVFLDQNGKTLHFEKVDKGTEKYGRNFNFSELKDGEYTIQVRNGKEMVGKTISLSTANIVKQPDRVLVAVN
ncbi:hypothetical protein [Persicitalea jodogahamensis]|uniref:Uncharacterized protein n=1 Tax=Persicitalea jodogahamensis TaxID=402147 RepID=A0A8J3DF64_9BACT|nr:hypothetical protein [Persicitalea jodogahamensis]GHB85718.1 hypothetical protein GCM10007390_46490 [Persicitalea jodogahamensis]